MKKKDPANVATSNVSREVICMNDFTQGQLERKWASIRGGQITQGCNCRIAESTVLLRANGFTQSFLYITVLGRNGF